MGATSVGGLFEAARTKRGPDATQGQASSRSGDVGRHLQGQFQLEEWSLNDLVRTTPAPPWHAIAIGIMGTLAADVGLRVAQ